MHSCVRIFTFVTGLYGLVQFCVCVCLFVFVALLLLDVVRAFFICGDDGLID